MSFKDLLYLAKSGDETAFCEIQTMYYPLLMKESIVDGVFSEDIFQEQCLTLFKYIHFLDFSKA